jgi:hypothetical protein
MAIMERKAIEISVFIRVNYTMKVVTPFMKTERVNARF